jgi:hypothetical protein
MPRTHTDAGQRGGRPKRYPWTTCTTHWHETSGEENDREKQERRSEHKWGKLEEDQNLRR